MRHRTGAKSLRTWTVALAAFSAATACSDDPGGAADTTAGQAAGGGTLGSAMSGGGLAGGSGATAGSAGGASGGAAGVTAGTGGSGGSAGSAGSSGTLGAGAGAGGSGGAAGAAAGQGGAGGTNADAVICPIDVPEHGSACSGSGQCFHGDGSTNTVFECFHGVWLVLAVGSPAGADGCPAADDPSPVVDCAAGQGVCVYEPNLRCLCAAPGSSCSGVAPAGPPPEPSWGCGPVSATACDLAPQQGAACPEVGLRCDPACCGWAWNCTESGWQAEDVPCPP